MPEILYISLLFQVIILIFSVVIHEVSHGAMANYLGDPTAKYAGRLTLNPIAHLDMWGSVLIPLFLILINSPVLFGWAKPVPYNPFNLRDQKYGPALVGLAGPASNLILAFSFGLLIRFMLASGFSGPLIELFSIIVLLNLMLAIFNLVPIPPLDGSKILFAILPDSMNQIKQSLEQYGLVLFIFFLFFAIGLVVPIIFWLFRLITGYPIEFILTQ